MKTTKIILIFLVAFFVLPVYSATQNTNGDDKASAKTIQKERERKIKEDKKFLAQSKKAFWKAQSKQVKKTIKESNKRNRQNNRSNSLLY